MYTLHIHASAEADLNALKTTCLQAAARLAVLLEEISQDQDLLECLTIDDYGSRDGDKFDVSEWKEQLIKEGRELWRLKDFDLERKRLMYRVIYAYVPGLREYHVLAIAPRSFNYDASHSLTKRIVDDYEEL